MSLSVIGSSVRVMDPTGDPVVAVFIPDSTWHRDDILILPVAFGTSSAFTLAVSDDSGQSLNWHRQTTAGLGTFNDGGGYTFFGLYARIPAALAGSSAHISVTCDPSISPNRAIAFEGLALRGGKLVHRRHMPVNSSDTNDYSRPSAVAAPGPLTATLPAHAPGTNDGTAGALEYVISLINQADTGTPSFTLTYSGGTIEFSSVVSNWDGGLDTWLAAGYKLHAAGAPANETNANVVMSGWASGSIAHEILRMMWVIDVNVAPSATIASATDLGSLQAELVANAFDWEETQDNTSYPKPTVVVDWGDGSATDTFTADGINKTTDHTYSEGGTYTITVTATDEEGLTGVDTINLHVAGPNIGFAFVRRARRVEIRELPHTVNAKMVGGVMPPKDK